MWDKIKIWWYRWSRKTHIDNAAFLMDGGRYRCMNYLSHTASLADFSNMVSRCRALKADTLYLYFSNEKDGSPAPTSFYANNLIGGSVVKSRIESMHKKLMLALQKGMYIDGWLFADDSPGIARQSLDVKLSYVKTVIEHFDPYVDRWVIALEANEYMSQPEVIAVATVLKRTGKPVGLHMTPGKYEWSKLPDVDIHYHQYGFNKSERFILDETRKVIAGLGGKKVIAAEYDLSSANRALGDAAMRAGAIGTGNGRTV
jgi:hypothetical protein